MSEIEPMTNESVDQVVTVGLMAAMADVAAMDNTVEPEASSSAQVPPSAGLCETEILATGSIFQLTNLVSSEESHDPLWEASTLFSIAVQGLCDVVFSPILLATKQIELDGTLSFSFETDVPPLPVDRHGTCLVGKKAKKKPTYSVLSQSLKQSQYVGYSRAPSRMSSRGTSVVSGKHYQSTALSTSSLMMQVSKLALKGSPKKSPARRITADEAPFKITEWNEGSEAVSTSRSGAASRANDHEKERTTGYMALSSRYSLSMMENSSTARSAHIPEDHQERQRREVISREIDSRDAREQLTARIERKGHLKLKLRSMVDPHMSVEQEDRALAAGNARSGAMSRGSPGKIVGSSRQPIRALASVTSVPHMFLNSADPTAVSSSRSHETTYRSEDYDGLDSDLVVVQPNGELLVGENCFLVARKPRAELQQDLFQQNQVQPRINVPTCEPERLVADPNTKPKLTEKSSSTPLQSVSSPAKSPSRPQAIKNPMFEAMEGSFECFPKIELDPKKTLLSKGVTIATVTPVETTKHGTELELARVQPPSTRGKASRPLTSLRDPTNIIAEDSPNDALESSHANAMTTSAAGRTSIPSSRRAGDNVTSRSSIVAVLPRSNRLAEAQSASSIRSRTPATGRTPNRGPTSFLDSLVARNEAARSSTDVKDEELHASVKGLGTLKSSAAAQQHTTHSKAPGFSQLPKMTYMREFPTPPKGQIHVLSTQIAASLVDPVHSPPPSRFPFESSLPTVIRGKR